MDQGKGLKLLYTVFLIAVTARTVIAIYDRFNKKDEPNPVNK
jgi:hypothetical protein